MRGSHVLPSADLSSRLSGAFFCTLITAKQFVSYTGASLPQLTLRNQFIEMQSPEVSRDARTAAWVGSISGVHAKMGLGLPKFGKFAIFVRVQVGHDSS